MERLIEYANQYHAGRISRFEFRTMVANDISERFTADDVDRLVEILQKQEILG